MTYRPSTRKLALVAAALAALLAVYLLLAWLALPHLLQAQAEKFVSARTAHRLSLDLPEFNPFAWRLHLTRLRLEEADGQLLLALPEVDIDLSASSLLQRAPVFDRIRLQDPEAHIVLRADGRLNWSAFLDALANKDTHADSTLPRLDIESFVLAGGKLSFADQRANFATRIEALDLELSDLSTLADDKGRYKLSARTGFGARVRWQGEATMLPLALTGTLQIDDVDLGRLAPYLQKALPVAPPVGTAAWSSDYRLAYAQGKLDLSLEHMSAKLSGLRLQSRDPGGPAIAIGALEARNGHFKLGPNMFTLPTLTLQAGQVSLPAARGKARQLLQLDGVTLDNTDIDLSARSVAVARLTLQGGWLKTRRDAHGQLDILAALQLPAGAPRAGAATSAPAAPAWHYRLNKFELGGFAVSFADEAVTPTAELGLEDLALAVDDISDDLATSLPLRASLRLSDGGTFTASGQVSASPASADLRIKLADLALQPAQAYLSTLARLRLAAGRLDIDGQAHYDRRGGEFKGGFALRDLRLDEADTGELFLALKSLSSRAVQASPARLEMAQLDLDGLDSKFIIAKDKSVNLSRILQPATKPGPAPEPARSAAAAAATPDAAAAPALALNIDRLRVTNAEMDFADLSLALPFATRIHHLRGAAVGLSSRPGTTAQLELQGQVDDYGLARVAGQIDLLKPRQNTDLRLVFRNVEMNRLTPYAATFAGRKIDSGKLSLDLQYTVKQSQLQGNNQVIMDQLTLGERVDSPTATNLPLDLAIAILQDADGRIDLGLPVAGSLDDPQFSYGAIIWKAIVNVLGKIATAPIRALGSLFGDSDKFAAVAFEAGHAQPTPPEREKLVRLASALNKRPGLSLRLQGIYAEVDRSALQDRQLRHKVADRAGQSLDDRDFGGPLSTRSPKVQAALEALFAEGYGSAELASLKEGFRHANPGQLEQGAGGKMISRLSGLLREQRVLGSTEVEQLKGVDFYALLFERLRPREVLSEEQLLALAKARGDNSSAILLAAGAPKERLLLGAPEQGSADGNEVPLRLQLGATPRVRDSATDAR